MGSFFCCVSHILCHAFPSMLSSSQPLGASGVRHGMTGQVQNTFFDFGPDGKPRFEFKGKALLRGETDGSSYPNGGMRATHTAGG